MIPAKPERPPNRQQNFLSSHQPPPSFLPPLPSCPTLLTQPSLNLFSLESYQLLPTTTIQSLSTSLSRSPLLSSSRSPGIFRSFTFPLSIQPFHSSNISDNPPPPPLPLFHPHRYTAHAAEIGLVALIATGSATLSSSRPTSDEDLALPAAYPSSPSTKDEKTTPTPENNTTPEDNTDMGLFRKKSTKTPVVAAVSTDAAPSGISEEPSVAPVSEEEQHPQQPTTDYSADGPTSAVIASSSLPASPGNTGESVATEANAVPVASEGRHDHDGPHSKLLTSLSEENKREYSDRANVAPVVREADANDASRPAYNEAAEPSSTGDVGTGTEHESGLAAPLIYGEDGIETNQNSHPSHADTAAVGGLAGAGAGVAAGSALHDGQQSQQQQPVADDAMTRGFTPVPTSTGGADVSRSNSTAAAQAPGGSTVSDDGMMRGFTPVPTGPGGGVS